MLNKQAKDDGCILAYLLVNPLLREEELEELVGHDSRAEVPRTVISGTVSMGTTQGMSTAEGNHFTVIKAHAAKDVSDMLLVLGGVGEAAIWSASRGIVVLTARSPWDGGTLQLLDGTGTGKSPEIRVGDPWEFGYSITNVSNTVMLNVLSTPQCDGLDSPLTGSKKSRAVLRPALAPWLDSGSNLMVAPLLPPVLVSLQYVPDACQARRTRTYQKRGDISVTGRRAYPGRQ